jgi:hypothetical protein
VWKNIIGVVVNKNWHHLNATFKILKSHQYKIVNSNNMKLATKQRVIPEVRGYDLKRSNGNFWHAIHERERKFICEECEWSSKFLTLVDFVQYVKGRK